MLLRSFEDETVRRVAAGAIANLAMNGNSKLILVLSSRTRGLSSLFYHYFRLHISSGFQYNFLLLLLLFVFAELNQELIMLQGGISLLSITAADAEDPQTLRMVAGAIANLCGNGIQSFFRQLFCFLIFSVIHLIDCFGVENCEELLVIRGGGILHMSTSRIDCSSGRDASDTIYNQLLIAHNMKFLFFNNISFARIWKA